MPASRGRCCATRDGFALSKVRRAATTLVAMPGWIVYAD
jgi:hypothetical protein